MFFEINASLVRGVDKIDKNIKDSFFFFWRLEVRVVFVELDRLRGKLFGF